MKILLISDTYPPDFGGMARSAARLVNNLQVQGYSVTVLSAGDKASGYYQSLKKPKDILHNLKLRAEQMIRKDSPGLLIGFYVHYSAYVAVYLGKLFGIPSLISARGNDIERGLFDPQKMAMVSYSLKNCSHLTSVSQYLVDLALVVNPELSYTVVNNGIILPEHFEREEFDGEWMVVGFFGDSREKKGLDLLLEATQLLEKLNNEKWKVLIGGKIDEGYKEGINSLSSNNIRYKLLKKLPADQIDVFYSQIHCLIVPSRYEGMPNVMLEAISRRIPVIHSNSPSMSEYFPENLTIAFENNDYRSLANALQRMRENYHALRVDEAYSHLLQNYTAEKEAEKWYKAIGGTLDSHHS